ncbi:nuclear RNA export factor 2 [Bactrocera dorsalis]|uniref:Nuclear RNA export factor 2 n=2 Tax=Bactrocera dorsalis TaxID=27457 RepID=A0ABM3K8S2_BACDO|nr:nuclear RNA export factor 2 [Bactrocera dorsalis]
MAISRPDEVYQFSNNLPIEVSYKNTTTYTRCNTYDPRVIAQGNSWHQIVVQHNGKFGGRDSMPEILQVIFEAVEGEELFPVAYRRGVKNDRFLVRNCKAAINKLFEHNLRVQLSDASFVHLQVHFNVGDYKFGQISPHAKLVEALNRLYTCMERVNGVDGILNLCRFNTQMEFCDLVVNLGNCAVFETICNLIYGNDDKFRLVNGLILSDNGITTVTPLKVFAGAEFVVLDLSKNKITSSSRLCRDLSEVKADELLLAGNPITTGNNYPDCLRPIQKNFKLVDGIPIENLSKLYSPLDYEVDINRNGHRVDLNNKKDILKFQQSNDWHAIVIPDSGQEFTKHEIMDYFFITVSPKLSEIYPCYYKFSAGEHQFLVRQCFDQLKHLVDICKMEINVPRLTTIVDKYSALSEIQIDKTLKYYMLMNVRPFIQGQIEPMECIDKALTRRYNGINRQLNLDNFESVEGLENIVINLSSPKILRRVLTQASRKLLTSCVELRLTHNKITNANVSKVLNIMSNLKAIDLGNNWILDLENVKKLSALGLKTLRLDGNPLCTKYSSAGEYVKAVRRLFPELTKLDNIEIQNKGYLSSQKNFLCDVRGYDFVNEFVPRFFKCFDSHDRSSLKELYHRNAIFTFSFKYIVAQMTSQNFKRISKYRENCRNILKISDLSRAHTSIFLGANQIMEVFFQLPSTRHDLLTFNTDTMIYNENMITLTINGVFYDQAPSVMDTDILMSFTRTFVLMPVETKLGILNKAIKYQIVNEQLSIYNPTSQQLKNTFKYFKGECQDDNDAVTVSDKEALLIMFQEVTKLKPLWCTRFLEDAKWNFKKSLLIFLNFCDNKKIPETAFN